MTPITAEALLAWARTVHRLAPAGSRLVRAQIPGNLAVISYDGQYIGYADPILGVVDIYPNPPEEQP